MKRRLATCAVMFGMGLGVPAPAASQISFAIDDGTRPRLICTAFNHDTLTKYSTGEVANNPKAQKRFQYYLDKRQEETGEKLSKDCVSFTGLHPDYRRELAPGNSFTNLNKRTVNVVQFPGLPSDWHERPVPGEDGEKKADKAGLKSLALLYGTGEAGSPGYAFAAIDLNYRFIACMGEVHVAYSLDPDTIKVGDTYVTTEGSAIPTEGAEPPKPESVRFSAVVKPVLSSKHLQHIDLRERYALIGDHFAGPALGYGCFSGQTKKVGMVADIVRGKHEPDMLDAILNESLTLDEGRIGGTRILRNASLERSKAQREREAAQAAREAEWQKLKADYEEKLAAANKAQEKYQRELEAQKESEAQARTLLAEHEAKARAHAEAEAEFKRKTEEYEAQLQAWKAQTGNE